VYAHARARMLVLGVFVCLSECLVFAFVCMRVYLRVYLRVFMRVYACLCVSVCELSASPVTAIVLVLASHCNIHTAKLRTATYCNALQHTTTHCYTLQHTVAHCSTL